MRHYSAPSNMDKRFYGFLLDGGFSFDEYYEPAMYAIEDRLDPDNPIRFLEFFSKKKCNDVVEWLNKEYDEKKALEEECEKYRKMRSEYEGS